MDFNTHINRDTGAPWRCEHTMPWGACIYSNSKWEKNHGKCILNWNIVSFHFYFEQQCYLDFFPSFCMLHAFSYLPVPLHTREPPSLCLYTSILYESLCPASSVTACLWPRCFWERVLQDWFLLGLRVPKWARRGTKAPETEKSFFLKCVCLGFCCCFSFSSKSCSPFHWPEK